MHWHFILWNSSRRFADRSICAKLELIKIAYSLLIFSIGCFILAAAERKGTLKKREVAMQRAIALRLETISTLSLRPTASYCKATRKCHKIKLALILYYYYILALYTVFANFLLPVWSKSVWLAIFYCYQYAGAREVWILAFLVWIRYFRTRNIIEL